MRNQDVRCLVDEFGPSAKCSRKRFEFCIWAVLNAFLKATLELQLVTNSRGEPGPWEVVQSCVT
eukprot:1763015-Amphidinium_carterae.1